AGQDYGSSSPRGLGTATSPCDMTTQESRAPIGVSVAHAAIQLEGKVLCVREATDLLVASRIHDSENERFKLFDVVGLSREVHIEPVPRPVMPVTQVCLDASHEIARETNVVQPFLTVEGVYPRLFTNDFAKQLGIRLKAA